MEEEEQEGLITYRDFAKLWILIESQDELIKGLSVENAAAKVLLTSVLHDKGGGALAVTPAMQARLENFTVSLDIEPALFGQEKGPIPRGRKKFTQLIQATLLQRKSKALTQGSQEHGRFILPYR